MEMIVAFEETYHIEFSFEEIVAMQSVASIKRVLTQKGVGT
jgi:acyl carrier protein